jgi:hypothetical protein
MHECREEYWEVDRGVFFAKVTEKASQPDTYIDERRVPKTSDHSRYEITYVIVCYIMYFDVIL